MTSEILNNIGEEFGDGLRKSSQYNKTQKDLEKDGITDKVLNQTPPVGLNLRLIAEMPLKPELKKMFDSQPINTTILGIAIADGVPDFQRFLHTALNTSWKNLEVIDFDPAILQQVAAVIAEKNLTGVNLRETDARSTGIESGSQQIVLRDHLGNCCPPVIDRQIDQEVNRILISEGLSIVNITTSEILTQSPNRQIINFDQLQQIVGPEIIAALQSEIFDLSQLERKFGQNWQQLRGLLLEIEPNKSFVIFGEDKSGHGEWFRSLNDHLQLFQNNGFKILAMQSRKGDDSHQPPLRCQRHNLILQKK